MDSKRLLFSGIFLLLFFVCIQTSSAQECNCTSCSDCQEKINSSLCSEIRLTADIENLTDTCITLEDYVSNKTLDCQGHEILGGNGTDPSGGYGIYLGYLNDNVTIQNCNLRNWACAIKLWWGTNSVVRYNNVTNTVWGINLDRSDYNFVYNNYVYPNYTGGNNFASGIYIYPYSNNNYVYGNEVIKDRYCIFVWNSDNNTLRNNIARNCTYYGIYSVNSDYGVFSNNSVWNNTYQGVYVSDSDYCIIANNTVTNNSDDGVYISSDSNDNSLTNNFVCGNSNDADIKDDDSNSGYGNICDTTSGWNDDGMSGCTYSCDVCACSSCDECEQKLNDTLCSTVVLDSSIEDYSSGKCIDNVTNFHNKTFDCMNHMIDGTDVFDSYGIVMIGKFNVTVQNCVINDFDYGILLSWSKNNTLRNNQVTNNNATGIYVTYSANNTFINNTASNNGYHGFYMRELASSGNFLSYNRFCSNNELAGSYYDLYDADSNSGDNNTCDRAFNWLDNGTIGCTYACNTTLDNICYCSNCDDCEERIDDPLCREIRLDANVTNQSGYCISYPANLSNKAFDCGGNMIDGAGTRTGISVVWINNATIRDCRITDFVNGVDLYQSTNLALFNNTLYNNSQYGIYVETSNNSIIANNTASNNQVHGIYMITAANNNTVEENIVSSNWFYGIAISTSSGNVLRNNTITENNYSGIYLTEAGNHTITGNNASGNMRYGIWMLSTSSNNTLSNNRFCYNNLSGEGNYTDIRDADSNSGDYNTCDTTDSWNDTGYIGCRWYCNGDSGQQQRCGCSTGTYEYVCGETVNESCNMTCDILNASNTACFTVGSDGITIDGMGYTIAGIGSSYGIYSDGKSNITIRNANIQNFSQSGIYMRNSAGNRIENSNISRNGATDASGIHFVNVNSSVIQYNNISENDVGIYLGSSSNNNLLTNNMISSNWYGDGLTLYYSSNNTIRNNVVNNNTDRGISLQYSPDNVLDNNTVNNNTNYGINLQSSENNTLIQNIASNNTYYGIWITTASKNNTLQNNTVTDNHRDGVRIEDASSTGNVLSYNTMCGNNRTSGLYYDIFDADGNSGQENTCNTYSNWNDQYAFGCRYTCNGGIRHKIALVSGWNLMSIPVEYQQ